MNVQLNPRVRIAALTLDAINNALELDQGAKFRGLLKKYMPLMGDAYDDSPVEARSHMGASMIGRECAREIWYSWRWAAAKKIPGRMTRLFNRGHLEEARMLALLEMIGCQVWHQDAEGKQFRITGYMGHFGGGTDGVIKGIPEMPEEPMLSEFKTSNTKAFKTLVDEGVRSAKFEHFVQMCIYMHGLNLRYAIYITVNKDTDDLYAEIVEIDHEIVTRYYNRSKELILATEAPKRISESSAFWKCKFCDFQKVCHDRRTLPQQNCRTCKLSRILPDGKWECTALQKVLTKSEQIAGCPLYTVHSSLG